MFSAQFHELHRYPEIRWDKAISDRWELFVTACVITRHLADISQSREKESGSWYRPVKSPFGGATKQWLFVRFRQWTACGRSTAIRVRFTHAEHIDDLPRTCARITVNCCATD
jgi:hypothetical protein